MIPQGRDRLKAELDRLKKERPNIAAAIEEARAHGDLKENAEYHAAKDKQGMMEARIRQLETKLALAQVVDPVKLGAPASASAPPSRSLTSTPRRSSSSASSATSTPTSNMG